MARDAEHVIDEWILKIKLPEKGYTLVELDKYKSTKLIEDESGSEWKIKLSDRPLWAACV